MHIPPSKHFHIANRVLAIGLAAVSLPAAESVVDLSAFPVYAGAVTETGPATAVQLSDRMEREVRVDLQTRGGARYQTDISIRGGIFEGTGLLVGGLALFDPQTGHYFSEIPLDPSFFSGARLLTGVSNGLYGFNSTAGSIDWQWAEIEGGGFAGLTVGSDSLLGFQAQAGEAAGAAGWQVAVTREKGDGSVAHGDFDLKRVSARLEFKLGSGKLRLFGGYVDKFYGWPSMYTGIEGLNETDDYQVSLLGWQYELQSDRQHHRMGGYWRKLDDDYEFNRVSPNKFFEHLTEVWSVQGDGFLATGLLDFSYRWAVVKDELKRSTSLVNGRFNEREYAEAAILAQRRISTAYGEWIPYAGMGLDTSNRDATVGLPLAGVRLTSSLEDGAWEVYAEYSEASQVPGYTVLNSATSGLFGGNPYLGREKSETTEAGFFLQKGSLSGKVVVFQRQDEDLVDWVFSSDSPSARQASRVDLEVTGIEAWLRWERAATIFEAGYAWLDKDPRYGDASVDASFYALNYAEKRVLASIEQSFREDLSVRLEAEYRRHPGNSLRGGGDDAFKLHFQATWSFHEPNWLLLLRVDNLTDESFESVPGTPGPGREGRLTVGYSW